MTRFARSGRMIAIMVVVSLIVFVGRIVWANGIFSSAPAGFSGSCKLLAHVPGVQDIAVADGIALISVASDRGPDGRDGIYLTSEGGTLTRLKGTPADFHPRGIGLYRSPDGSGIFVMAVNRRSSGKSSIDSFEVIDPKTKPALVAQGTIEGGLLSNPQDVAPAGPGAFYVSNGSAKQPLVKRLASWGVLPGSDILYFNGMSFRVVAEDLYGARGLLLAPDGNQLLVASLTTRSLRAFSRDVFNGNLTEADSLTLPAAPEGISLDTRGEVWVGGHASLLRLRDFTADGGSRAPSQIFRVSLASGVPQAATQVYGDDGRQIAAAGIGASLGKRLLIGSPLDDKLLDCTAN